MSEMVERVADSIAKAHGFEAVVSETMYLELARAAIEAMREPTAPMLACRVSLPWDREDHSYYLDSETVGELWDDLIDAALTPTPPEQ